MKKIKPILIIIGVVLAAVLLTLGGLWIYRQTANFTFHHTVSGTEVGYRLQVVKTAEKWLGHNENDGSHQEIIDLYNAHSPLAQNYEVQYDDEWCATFVSAVAIECGLTDIIPTECGCERQIGLFQELGSWEEDDSYTPLPGDIIYYCWTDTAPLDDCTGWSNHVGIVIGTAGPFLKVIEGNYSGQVAYRIIPLDSIGIRGYAVPDYPSSGG